MTDMKWKPEIYCQNPIANAIYNLAAATDRQAQATGRLLYGMTYGGAVTEGMSIAEAIEVGASKIAEASRSVEISSSEGDYPLTSIGDQLQNVADAIRGREDSRG